MFLRFLSFFFFFSLWVCVSCGLKSLLHLLQYCFCWFRFCFSGYEACGILVPWPGIKSPCIGRQSLNHWTTRSPNTVLLLVKLYFSVYFSIIYKIYTFPYVKGSFPRTFSTVTNLKLQLLMCKYSFLWMVYKFTHKFV